MIAAHLIVYRLTATSSSIVVMLPGDSDLALDVHQEAPPASAVSIRTAWKAGRCFAATNWRCMDYLFIGVVILCVHGGYRGGDGELEPKLVEVVREAAGRSGIGRDDSCSQNTSHQASVPSPRRFLQFPSLSSCEMVAVVTGWACESMVSKKKRRETPSLADLLGVLDLHTLLTVRRHMWDGVSAWNPP